MRRNILFPFRNALWFITIAGLLLSGAILLVSSPPPERSDTTTVTGTFDRYISDNYKENEADQIYLSNGLNYYIIFNDIQTPWHCAFHKSLFLDTVKKGQDIMLLVYHNAGCEEIMMIQSGATTYMSFQDAVASSRISYYISLFFSALFALVAVICFFINILHKAPYKNELPSISSNHLRY